MSLPPAIECKGLTKHYPHFAVRNLDLSLEQGAVMGLVGPNGAGKSTLLRMVMGLVEPDSGTISVLGHAMPGAQCAAKRNIGFIADDMRLYESETIAFHMEFIKSIFASWDEGYAQKLLQQFDLNQHQKIKGLSHGQRVKAMLLLALARRPKLLVFDEPTVGLDPAARKSVITEMMNALADETHTILFSSHNTMDVEQVSDYITFINGGQVIDSRDKEEFMDSWRRLRLINMGNYPLPDLPNIKDAQGSGRLCAVTVNNYSAVIPARFSDAGWQVDAIERLSLEEIFLCNLASINTNRVAIL